MHKKTSTPFRNKEELKIKIKKARSLLSTIEKMIEQDRYCPDIMQQILAVIGLLKSLHKELYKHHLTHCFSKLSKNSSNELRDQMIEELVKITSLLNK